MPSEPEREKRGRKKHRSRIAEWGGRFLLLVFSSAVALGLGELLVRLVEPQQLILLRPDVWISDDGLGWKMAPHLDTRVNTGEREIRLVTDADGYRVAPAPRATGESPAGSPTTQRHVLALGDSFLAAIQVTHEDLLTTRLERRLERHWQAPARVVNAAVGDYGPNRYLLLARRELARRERRYEAVLVFLFRGNDVVSRRVEHFPPKQSSVRHRFRWPRSARRGELVDALLYPLNDALETRSHLFLLTRQSAWHLLMRLGLSARQFPRAELVAAADGPRFAVTGEICADVAAVAAEHGVPSFFVLLPGIYHVAPEIGHRYASGVGLAPGDYDLEQSARLLAAELARHGLRFYDLTPALRQAHARGIETHGRVDTHLSPAGHRLVAEELWPFVRRLVDGER